MDKELSLIRMEISMKVNGKMTCSMGKGHSLISLVEYIAENGEMV